MPRIFLNASNLKVGGIKQVLLNFILQIQRAPEEFDWHYAISPELAQELQRSGIEQLPQATVFEHSPAQDRRVRKEVQACANRVQPDAVFTFAGPTYIKFAQPHLMGMYDPWVSHAGRVAYQCLGFPKEWIKFKLLVAYKSWWAQRADWWVTETETARQGLHQRLGLPLSKIAVVSNAAGGAYTEFRERRAEFPDGQRAFKMLCFCAPYKHKNLSLLPKVAHALRRQNPNFAFQFILTLPQDGPDWASLRASIAKLGVEANFDNRGPVLAMDGPQLYRDADCLFLPTVLETFSATYPEAMNMGLPIITPRLDYLQDVCRDAAIYFSPYDAEEAAARVLQLSNDKHLWNQLINAGKRRLQDFPEPPQKKELYFNLLRKMLHET